MHVQFFSRNLGLLFFLYLSVFNSYLSFAQTKVRYEKIKDPFSLIHFCDPQQYEEEPKTSKDAETRPCVKEAFFSRLSKDPLHAFVNFDSLGFDDETNWSSSIKMCFIGTTTAACNILKRLGNNSEKSYVRGGHEMTWVLSCKAIEKGDILLKLKSRHDWVSKEKTGSFTLSVCEEEDK